MRRLLTWLWPVPLLALAGWLAWQAYQPPVVTVVQPRRGLAVEVAYATGTVEPTVMTPIAPRVAARLTELTVDEGDDVKAGQVLARLEDDDLRSQLDAARAVEANARSIFERNAELLKSGRVSRQAYDQSKANWEAAKADVARAEAQIAFLALHAPADGRIIRRDGEVGQLIGINTPVFWIATGAPLRITSEVDEEDIARVQVGQKVLIRADAFPGRSFDGTVQTITPKGDAITRSYRVRIALPPDTPLMIGMTAETNIVLREAPDALLVPASAVAAKRVLVLNPDNTVHARDVELGAKDAKQVEIRAGLSDSDWIVDHASDTLAEGQTVQPARRAGP